MQSFDDDMPEPLQCSSKTTQNDDIAQNRKRKRAVNTAKMESIESRACTSENRTGKRPKRSKDSDSHDECSPNQQQHEKEITESVGEKFSMSETLNETIPPKTADKSKTRVTPSTLRMRKLRSQSVSYREAEKKSDSANRRTKRAVPEEKSGPN